MKNLETLRQTGQSRKPLLSSSAIALRLSLHSSHPYLRLRLRKAFFSDTKVKLHYRQLELFATNPSEKILTLRSHEVAQCCLELHQHYGSVEIYQNLCSEFDSPNGKRLDNKVIDFRSIDNFVKWLQELEKRQ